MKRERRRPGLWSMVAVVATLIMAMLFAGLLLAFRFLLKRSISTVCRTV